MHIPTIVEVQGKEEKHYDIYSRLLKDNIIQLNGEIDNEMSSIITSELLILSHQDPAKEISIYINSPGGEVSSGLAIYDIMQYISNPIKTVVIGEACSMASFIASGGSKGSRFALPNSKLMYHQVLGGAYGQASDIEISANLILRIKKQLNKILSNNTYGKVSYEEMVKMTDRNKWLEPEEAVKLGFIDKII